MTQPTDASATLSFPRYLAARKSFDDRSLNRHVWESLVRALADRPPHDPLRVLEVGAGIGTMVERCVDWRLFDGPAAGRTVEMTLVDDQPENVAEAKRRLPAWAAAQGLAIDATSAGFRFQRPGIDLSKPRHDLLYTYLQLSLSRLSPSAP